MSDAIRVLHDYLAKSPSVVFPQDVLEFLPAIKAENDKLVIKLNTEHIVRLNVEAENAKLRKFISDILAYGYGGGFLCSDGCWSCPHFQECFNCPIEEGPEKYVRRGCRWLALARELGVETSE